MSKNKIIGITLGLISILFLFMTSQLPISKYSTVIGPKVFPNIASGGLLLCSIGLFFKRDSRKEKEKGPFLDKAGWIRVLKLLILLALFPLFFKYFGFIISSFLLLFIMITFFDLGKEEPIWKKLLASVLVTVILFVLFIFIIKVRLPAGVFIDRLFN